MNIIETGGPAFPSGLETGHMAPLHNGMTLRDYFAAKVMPAVYADYVDSARKIGFDEGWMDGVARDAYAMADAMLKVKDSQ